MIDSVFAIRFLCEIITPLGIPVDPEVKIISAHLLLSKLFLFTTEPPSNSGLLNVSGNMHAA
jgi:hypothetical protein